jgi:hypothetical protein
MSTGDLDAMGVQFGKPTLIDPTVTALQPEVIVYEPGTNGEMSLVGTEFIIPFVVLPKSGAAPTPYGQKLLPDDVIGRSGLHVWTHRASLARTNEELR